MISVTDAWGRIHEWLSTHAPKIIDNLNPPATKRELVEAETSFGNKMPDEWRDLYRIHNGMNSDSNMGSLFYGMQFLSLEEAIREQRNMSAPANDASPVRAADCGIRRDNMYNAKWVALAHDCGETLIRIDMDPAQSGRMGQVIFTDYADDTVILLNKNLTEFMSGFVHHLEEGRYHLNQDALVEGNQWLDCDSEIDVVNWAHSSRWKHLAY